MTVVPVVTIYVRHCRDCEHREDEQYRRGRCRKHLRWTWKANNIAGLPRLARGNRLSVPNENWSCSTRRSAQSVGAKGQARHRRAGHTVIPG